MTSNVHLLTRRNALVAAGAGLLVTAAHGRTSVIAQTPEASPIAGPETLFDVVFQRDWQPEGKAQGAFYRITLQPGDELTYLPGPYCGCSGETIKDGTAAEVILSGPYSVQLDRPWVLRRPGGEDEEIQADAEVELTGGDVAIYPDALAFGTLRNTSDEEIIIFGASITSIEVEAGTFTPPLPENMSARLSVAVYDAWQTLGDGDIRAQMTRETLTAGATIGPYPIEALEAIHAASGEFHSSIIQAGESTPTADPLFVREGGTAAFRKFTPGAQRMLSNQGEIDASLITLRFQAAQ